LTPTLIALEGLLSNNLNKTRPAVFLLGREFKVCLELDASESAIWLFSQLLCFIVVSKGYAFDGHDGGNGDGQVDHESSIFFGSMAQFLGGVLLLGIAATGLAGRWHSIEAKFPRTSFAGMLRRNFWTAPRSRQHLRSFWNRPHAYWKAKTSPRCATPAHSDLDRRTPTTAEMMLVKRNKKMFVEDVCNDPGCSR
jgi:hypothetical protein